MRIKEAAKLIKKTKGVQCYVVAQVVIGADPVMVAVSKAQLLGLFGMYCDEAETHVNITDESIIVDVYGC